MSAGCSSRPFGGGVDGHKRHNEERNRQMKRMLVPALALGVAMAVAKPAWAGHLFDGLSHGNGCCESTPACDSCQPACKPKCFSLCRPSCPKPCEPACPQPCDSCGGHRWGGHLRGLFGRCGHNDSCC